MASKLFVGNLSYEVGDEELREVFEPFGKVVSAQVITDRETGRSRGFGFVEMSTHDEADAAIAGLDGTSVHGRNIGVNPAKDNRARSR
ncbi:MAG: RNA-binding protein [Chlamydiia bacterium]|nr:RNA-binding protein [Chlamydiia bacterium]